MLFGVALLAGAILSAAAMGRAVHINNRLVDDFNRLVRSVGAGGLPPHTKAADLELSVISWVSVVGGVFTTYAAIGMGFTTSLLLLQLSDGQNTKSSLTWTFPPHAVALLALSATSALALFVTAFALIMAITEDRAVMQKYMRKFDNTSYAASALVAVVAVCLMPLVGGWDGVSGLAFTDVAPDLQGFDQNTVRYANLLAQQTAMLGVAISFITHGLVGMTFRVLR